MTENLKKSPATSPRGDARKKQFRFGAGALTIAFLSLCTVLTFGFCKFSFYVLKNHRNIVERSDFSNLYAEARAPHGSFDSAPEFFPDILYDAALTPAAAVKPAATVAQNENQAPKKIENAFVSADRRAPAARAATLAAFTVKQPSKDAPAEKSEAPLEDLISSGRGLLEENGEKLTQTATFFEEIPQTDEIAETAKAPETVKAPEKTPEAVKTVETASAQKKIHAPVKTAPAQKAEPSTHWVDIETLRKEISKLPSEKVKKEAAPAVRTAKADKKYTPADQMPETKQTAALPDAPVADVPAVKAGAVQEVKQEKKEEKTAGVKETRKQNKKKKRKNPWKIAMVGGKPVDNLAVEPQAPETVHGVAADKIENAEAPAVKSEPEKTAAAPTAAAENKSTIIYRNGKAKQIINADGTGTDLQPQTAYRAQRNADWLDGQEAAVWTNMSQSDVPSVWSFASQEDDTPSKTKAYKVAAEQETPAAEPQTNQRETKQETPAEQQPAKSPAKEKASAQPAAASVPPPAPAVAAKQPETQASSLPVAPVLPSVVQPLTNQKPAGAAPSPQGNQAPLFKKMSPDGVQNTASDEESFTGKLLSLFSKDSTPADKTSADAAAASKPLSLPFGLSKTTAPKQTKEVSKKDMATVLKNLKNAKSAEQNNILPEEIRLSFKDGTSDMAAPSVKLVKNFAKHAKDDAQTYIEVRVSDQMFDVQQQRFAIIRNILLSEGVDDAQILLYKSKRPSNSLVLRKTVISDEEYESHASWLNGEEERLYYKKW